MRIALIGLLGLGLALSAPLQAKAQDTGDTIAGGVSATSDMAGCVYQAEMQGSPPSGCVGLIAEPCLEGAVSTSDMVVCMAKETDFWDERLNLKYNELRDVYAQQDSDEPEGAIQLASVLKSTQVKWIHWRDAKCMGFERNRYRGGSLGRVTGSDCLMEMTAERVFELEELLAEARM
jgi:uncharacterized protein YecT (DUF1311 family)